MADTEYWVIDTPSDTELSGPHTNLRRLVDDLGGIADHNDSSDAHIVAIDPDGTRRHTGHSVSGGSTPSS